MQVVRYCLGAWVYKGTLCGSGTERLKDREGTDGA